MERAAASRVCAATGASACRCQSHSHGEGASAGFHETSRWQGCTLSLRELLMPGASSFAMKASSFLHCALRSPDPRRIGKFYADLFECGFFIHPVLAGLGVVMVKISSPDSVFRGILEFWPLDVHWEGTTASIRRVPTGPPPDAKPRRFSCGPLEGGDISRF